MNSIATAENSGMNRNIKNKYRYFEGEKSYQFPHYLNRDTSKANRYRLRNDQTFWFDFRNMRVATDDPRLYLQTLLRFDRGALISRLILNIDGWKIQISKFDGECLDMNPPKNSDGTAVWYIEEIGSPLRYFTGNDDARVGIKRPFDERYQILTNASKFESLEQQDRGLNFVTSALERYANIFSDGPAGGMDMPAIVKFSDRLIQKIEDGGLIDG